MGGVSPLSDSEIMFVARRLSVEFHQRVRATWLPSEQVEAAHRVLAIVASEVERLYPKAATAQPFEQSQ